MITYRETGSVAISNARPDSCNYFYADGAKCWESPRYEAVLRYCWCEQHPGMLADDCPDGREDDQPIPVCVDHAAIMRTFWECVVGMRNL